MLDTSFVINLILAGVSIALFMVAMRKKDNAPADGQMMQIIDRLNAEVAGLSDRLKATEGELKNTQGELRNVQTYAARLAMQVIRLGGEPVTMADIEDTSTGTIHVLSRDRNRLLRILRDDFSIDELDVVAFEIGISRGELGDGDIDGRALRLMEKAKAKGKLVDLAAIVWRERPDSARR